MRSFSAPASTLPILNARLGSQTFDPLGAALSVRDGAWALDFDGKDGQGHMLPNGIYQMEIKSDNGGSVQYQILAFSVLSQPKPVNSAVLAPNPVLNGQLSMQISWSPSQAAEVWIFDASGALVRSFAPGPLPPLTWDLKTVSGAMASNGIYLVAIRLPGERQSKVFKLALAR